MTQGIVRTFVGVGLAVAFLAAPSRAWAQADEIQVYDGGLAPKGVFNLTIHNNFTPKGLKTPTFAGGVTSDKSFNGVAEWALGVTDWFGIPVIGAPAHAKLVASASSKTTKR